MAINKLHLRPDFWIGVIFSLAALVHYMGKLDIPFGMLAETYWPSIFIVLGILQAFSTRYQDAGATIFLVTLGSILIVYNLDFFSSDYNLGHCSLESSPICAADLGSLNRLLLPVLTLFHRLLPSLDVTNHLLELFPSILVTLECGNIPLKLVSDKSLSLKK